MKIHQLRREQLIAVELDDIFEFFSHAHNRERITPPWLRFELLTPAPIEMRTGTIIDYRLRLHGLPVLWRSRIELWEPQLVFVDRAAHGALPAMEPPHEFESRGSDTLVRDIVHYAPDPWHVTLVREDGLHARADGTHIAEGGLSLGPNEELLRHLPEPSTNPP